MAGATMTYEEVVAKARALAASGNTDAAKRAWAMAESMKGSAPQEPPSEPVQPNPDGTYGQPPEGFIKNPYTGQMTSRELLAGNIDPSQAMSAASGGHQGLSFGFGDEVQGALNAAIPGAGTVGQRYAFGRDYSRAMLDASRRDHPAAAFAGEVGGTVATALTPLGWGGQAAAKAGQIAPRAVALAARAPRTARAAGSAASGAGLGGLYGWGSGDGGVSERAKNARGSALLGAGVGAITPFAGAGIQKYLDGVAGRRATREAAAAGKPTSELFDEGNKLYAQIADAGVTVKPTTAVRGYGDVAMRLADEAADEVYPGGIPHPTPASAAAYQTARKAAEEAARSSEVPFKRLSVNSRRFRNAAGSNPQNADDTRIAQGAKDQFDDWMLGLGPDDVVSGDVKTLTSTLPAARYVWSKAKKSQLIDKAVKKGENYLSGGASGIKNQFRSLLNNDKTARQFSPAEQAAMRRVIDGTVPEKLLDMMGSGLGQMATTAFGGAAGTGFGGLGAVGGALGGAGIGQLSRRASEAVARRNAETARAAISSGRLGGYLPVAGPEKRALIERILRAETAMAAGS